MNCFRLRKRLLITIAVTLALVLAALFFVRPSTRSVQVWGFLLPFAVLYGLADNCRSSVRRTFAGLYLAALWVGLVDAGIRGFLFATYRTDYFSGFVLDSLANTNSAEAQEFILAQIGHFLPWIVAVVVLGGICTWAVVCFAPKSRTDPNGVVQVRRTAVIATVALIAVFTVITWSKSSWRGHLPVFSWIKVYQLTEQAKQQWARSLRDTQQAVDKAKRLLTSVDKAPNTIVFVIGESMTSENMSLYGYERNTTPRLRTLAQKGELVALADSWSTEPSTVGAFNSMFRFSGGGERNVNLLALLDAAGYQITWISNQDDTAIKSRYMSLSDRVVQLNHLGGRSTVSLDEKVLEPLKEALNESHVRKAIFVHLIGCHPHYSMRYPDGLRGDWEDREDDVVQSKLKELGRGVFVRRARDHYDRAILYQDQVIAQTLALTKQFAGTENAFWCYLSDHGQEVGSYADWDGHSNITPAGYRIPFLLWGRGKVESAVTSASKRSFRADWIDSVLFEAAGIHWRGEMPQESLLNPQYAWKSPESKEKFVRQGIEMVPVRMQND